MSSRWEPEPTPLVKALRAKLEEEGMTLRKAGELVGVSGQTINNWAKGTVSITLNADYQHGLARLLDVSPRRVLRLAGFDLGSGGASDDDAMPLQHSGVA